MSNAIVKYFSSGKRRQLSSSSASDVSTSPDTDNKKDKQEAKKRRQDSETLPDDEMALQDLLHEIQASMTKLATKDDVANLQEKIENLRTDMENLRACFTTRVEKLESSVFDLECEKDKLKADLAKLRGEKTEIQQQLEQQTKEMGSLKHSLNDQEQHGRLWNLRVYGVQEPQGETTEDCVNKCVDIFAKKLGTPISAGDVEIAHRTGKMNTGAGGRPRPIIVRLFSRRQRGLILTARRKLKQSGVSVGEDLTLMNYKLLKQVSNHSATLTTWSSSGKIITKLKNGKTMKIDINTDIDKLFAKEMA